MSDCLMVKMTQSGKDFLEVYIIEKGSSFFDLVKRRSYMRSLHHLGKAEIAVVFLYCGGNCTGFRRKVGDSSRMKPLHFSGVGFSGKVHFFLLKSCQCLMTVLPRIILTL